MYTPSISNYKPFYIQTGSDTLALDTKENWGLVAKSNPYPLLPSVKTIYSNDWHDEDGKDEYTSAVAYKPLEFEVEFYAKAYNDGTTLASVVLRTQLDSFFSKIKKGVFKVYDSYAGLGFQNVRYNGYEEEEIKSGTNWFRTIFKIKFKADDPLTRMYLSDGVITQDTSSFRPYVVDTTLYFPMGASVSGSVLTVNGTVNGTTLYV